MEFKHKKYKKIFNTYDNKIYENTNIDEKKFNLLCSKYSYLPTFIKKVDRIIGIGDIHGDLDLTINFLKVGKLIIEINKNEFIEGDCIKIPKNMNKKQFQENYNNLSDILLKNINGTFNNNDFNYFKWIGNNTYVVQIGDQIDRCRPFNNSDCSEKNITIDDENSDLLIMEIFDCLHKIAIKYNGAVYSLIGNHEVMNFDGDFRYVSHRGIDDYKNNNNLIDERNDEFNKLRIKFACTRNAIIVIGNFVFVHGGLAHLLISKYKLQDINDIIRLYILNKFENIKDNDIKKFYKKIVNSTSISPLWYRNLAMIKPDIPNNNYYDDDCKTYYEPVEKYFKDENILEMKGLIIGHTPQLSIHNKGINTACNKKIIRIDIGASKAFNKIFKNDDINRKPQVIEIINNNDINILI
jgi:hypothetical protein